MVAHRNLPRLRGYTAVGLGVPFTSNIVLDRAELLEWENWNAPARDLLASTDDPEAKDDPIAIDAVIAAYQAAVAEFHRWFVESLLVRHHDALNRLEQDRTDLLDYSRKLFGPALEAG
jgi:hypothetical protein